MGRDSRPNGSPARGPQKKGADDQSRSRRARPVVILGAVARQLLLEATNGLPEAPAQAGQTPRTEDQHDDDEDDEKLGNPKAHGVRASAPAKTFDDQP